MDTKRAIEVASKHLEGLAGREFDLLNVTKPISPAAAVNLSKVVSKLSPLLGNLIEFNTVEYLNDLEEFTALGEWIRQDPGFPDALFVGGIDPAPGFEIKAWFPLATEITARFRDSQNHFLDDRTHVCMLAWLPEHLIHGTPRILDVCVVSGASVAASRDDHYHNPPYYLVREPEDTKKRTRNLQQTNTSGHVFQGDDEQLAKAKEEIEQWGAGGKEYSPSANYQAMLRDLMGRYPYRLDTNFAKMDRIVHPGVEAFKTRVLNTEVHGMKVRQWSKLLASKNEKRIQKALEERLGIREEEAETLLR